MKQNKAPLKGRGTKMKKTNELYYTFNLHNGILDITLERKTFWGDNIYLFETYEESYIHFNYFTNYYYQSFGNFKNKKNPTTFDYLAQKR